MSRVSVSPYSSFYSLQSKTPTEAKTNSYSNSLASVKPRTSFLLDKELRNKLGLRTGTLKKDFYRPIVRSSTGDSSSGDSDSKNILDAFFLGKALAEALNERIESAVGEVLSTVGRLQSEQQKQIQEFQADVLDRAKKAKQKAAKDATDTQERTSTSSKTESSAAFNTTSGSSSRTDTTTSAATSGSDETTASAAETS